MALDVFILHGSVGTGKSTGLADWSAGTVGATGILQMVGAEGHRVFRDIASGTFCSLEPVGEGETVEEVGRFRFRADAFVWANDLLVAAAADASARTIVIDEIGPLELRGMGLAPGLRAVMARPSGSALLVVRDTLVEEVRTAFGLAHAALVPAANWPQHGQLPSGAP